jgi:hypothetical protein
LKKARLIVALILAFIAIVFLPTSAFAGVHFGIGYEIEDKEFTVESEANSGFNYDSTAVFSSPIESGRINFGFDLTKNLSWDFSMFRSATSTVYTQSFGGVTDSIDLPVGIPHEDNEYFTITSSGWIGRPVKVGSNFSGSTKVRYRTSGGNTEFVYNFPTSWPKKDVVRFKGFVGYMKSNGITTTDFEARSASSSTGSEIIVVGDFAKTVTPEKVTYAHTEKVITGWNPVEKTFNYYKQTFYSWDVLKLFPQYVKKSKQEIIDYTDTSEDVTYTHEMQPDDILVTSEIAMVIPIDPSGVNGSTVASIQHDQEVEGGYLGLSMTYDIIKNLDMEIACRHMVNGHVQNTISGPGFSIDSKDDRPNITMAELVFTAHFVKGVDLKAGYSKTFASYDFNGVDYEDETGKISLVLDYQF